MPQGPKNDKDKAAEALAALAAGQQHDEPPQGSGVEAHAHVDLGQSGKSKPGSPPAPQPKTAAGVRPAAPPQPRGAPPRVPSAPPVRPNSPTADDSTTLAHDQEVAREADAVAHIVEDDDTLNMPAPTPDMIAYRRPAPPPRKRVHLSRTLGFKQTIIPILLTMGVLLPAIAGWNFALGEESPIADAVWIPLTLLGIGVIMLVLGVITMFQVKHQLDTMKQPGR
jgi:hypothetical protein